MSTQLVPQDKIVKIRRTHAEICSLSAGVLEKAIKLGGLLAELKALVPHGEWLPWIEQNIAEIPERTVRRYIQLWENRETIREELKSVVGDRFGELPTIQDALALIQKPRAVPVKRSAPAKEKRSRRTREVEATVTPAATPEPESPIGPPAERLEKISEPEPDDQMPTSEVFINKFLEALVPPEAAPTTNCCPTCGRPLPV